MSIYGRLTVSQVFIVSDSSTTYTSFSTFDVSSSVRTSTRTSAISTTIGIYTDYISTVTTFSGGAISTLSSAREAQVTTLSNGDYTTSYGSYSAVTTDASSIEASSTSSSDTDSFSSTDSATASATSSDGAAIAGGNASGTGNAAAAATSTSAASDNDDSSMPPASVLAGGIVGGVAGLAVLLLVAMIFLRWSRKRAANRQPLTEAESAAISGDAPRAPQGPGMATRPGLAPVLAPLLGGGVFKSRREVESGPPATGERGFQRVSGRKLPSAFSEGIEGRPSLAPGIAPTAFGAHGRDLSASSFYRDSTGFHGGEGPFADQGDVPDSNEMVSPKPGPARQAVLHTAGPYMALRPTSATTVSGPTSSTWPMSHENLATPTNGRFSPGLPLSPPGTGGRSATPATMSSFEGSRGSRFTEEV